MHIRIVGKIYTEFVLCLVILYFLTNIISTPHSEEFGIDVVGNCIQKYRNKKRDNIQSHKTSTTTKVVYI